MLVGTVHWWPASISVDGLSAIIRVGVNQPVNWFFGDKGLDIQQGTSVTYGLVRPNPITRVPRYICNETKERA